MEDHTSNVVSSQDASHGEGHDYVKGSPHLRHDVLRGRIAEQLRGLVHATIAAKGSCHVIEVGAGHGTFTEFLLDAGASVTVTEASRASAKALSDKYAGRDDVEVFYDTTGEDVFTRPGGADGVVCASLLHHIPDYLSFVDRLSGLVTAGGWFYSVQDPTYYPRRPRRVHLASRGTYFAWRLGQGDVRRGLATRWRRVRGVWSEEEPSDLVEYHVVREGVDEQALVETLGKHFDDVELFTYWSTQSPVFQRMFARFDLPSDFGLIGRSRREA